MTNTDGERFGYGDVHVFYCKILMKARLRSDVELYLQIQAEAWFELATAFLWQSKEVML